ncbi:unnamed protein product [Rangifer tarandus platyrhynchus]|uniref:Uncharacterized protein n=1 Tax=Rangifer tarandus platyrhynchus TaxID=3082113 RepID=A0ABN8ZWG4_RANTA|nr:unnamed protein product [Rangifer tarandus platyrhynchus]
MRPQGEGTAGPDHTRWLTPDPGPCWALQPCPHTYPHHLTYYPSHLGLLAGPVGTSHVFPINPHGVLLQGSASRRQDETNTEDNPATCCSSWTFRAKCFHLSRARALPAFSAQTAPSLRPQWLQDRTKRPAPGTGCEGVATVRLPPASSQASGTEETALCASPQRSKSHHKGTTMMVGTGAETPHGQGRAVGRGRGGGHSQGRAPGGRCWASIQLLPTRGCTRDSPTMSRTPGGTQAACGPAHSQDTAEPGLRWAASPLAGSSSVLHGHCLSTLHRAPASTPALWSSKPHCGCGFREAAERLVGAGRAAGSVSGRGAEVRTLASRSGDSPLGALPATPQPATGLAYLSRLKGLAALESKA